MKDKMMNMLRSALVVVVSLVFGAAPSRADEEKIPLDKVPAKVKEAIKAKFPAAELVSAEKEKEDGKTVFEVVIKNAGQKIEVIVDETGKIVAIEKVIAVKDLPKPVVEALEKKYPKATIKKVEEVLKGDKTTYELRIESGGKTLEVTFDSTGKFLEEEVQKDKK
jgi:uncharacterized membrane protein YkoI